MEIIMHGLGMRDSIEEIDYFIAKSRGANALFELGEKVYARAESLSATDPDSPIIQKLYSKSFAIMESASELEH